MEDATVVVTGGTKGIGESAVRAFAATGASVVTCSRDQDALASLAADLADAPGEVTTQRADVRDEYDVERLLETAAREGADGTIDVVVANAGVYHGDPGGTPLPRESYAAFDDHVRTNARGVFATFREAVPHLADDARLLVLSGRVARQGMAGYGSYAVSKAAAEAVARGFAADLDQAVGVVDPGNVETGLSGEGGRDPDDAAELVVWAAVEADADHVDDAVVDLRDLRDARA